eukprot:15061487-Alexandrium_andersonii.AAC.1
MLDLWPAQNSPEPKAVTTGSLAPENTGAPGSRCRTRGAAQPSLRSVIAVLRANADSELRRDMWYVTAYHGCRASSTPLG